MSLRKTENTSKTHQKFSHQLPTFHFKHLHQHRVCSPQTHQSPLLFNTLHPEQTVTSKRSTAENLAYKCIFVLNFGVFSTTLKSSKVLSSDFFKGKYAFLYLSIMKQQHRNNRRHCCPKRTKQNKCKDPTLNTSLTSPEQFF